MKNNNLYVLKELKPVLAKSNREWGNFFTKLGKNIFIDDHTIEYKNDKGDKRTIFLRSRFTGVDANFSGYGKPLVFETRVIAGRDDLGVPKLKRFSSYLQTREWHLKVLNKIRKELGLTNAEI